MIHLSHQDILNLLPDRDSHSHKGDYGKILVICGSRGYTGAAALACMGALRSGAGLVYLCVPECIYDIMAVKLNEPVIIPLKAHGNTLGQDAWQTIAKLLPKMDAVLIGCGLGISEHTQSILISLLCEYNGPVIIDADGITMLETHKDILRRRTGATIITPHEGEFTRFGGILSSGRIEAAKKVAVDTNSIIVLKGYETVITDGQDVYINATGNPGMATGGSGDVLAGIITSLVGQGLQPIDAAAAGAWLHGAAGDICAREIGQYGMLPSDIVQVLPRLMK